MDVRRAYDSGIPKMPDTISYKMTQDSQIFTFCKFHTYFENRYQYVTFWMCEICALSISIIMEFICIQRSHFHDLTYDVLTCEDLERTWGDQKVGVLLSP